MNIKTSLFGLGLLVAAGGLTISCGGSDGDSDGGGGSGNSSAGSGSAGTPSTAGTNSGTSGSNNGTSGSNNGTSGSNNNGGNTGTGGNNNGGRNNNQGGDDNNGNGGAAGEDCPATQPMDGAECTRMGGFQNGCEYGDITCTCQGRGGGDREWNCDDGGNPGGGGAGPDIPEADSCPDNAMNGDDCEGQGQCPGQEDCFCGGQQGVFCF